MPLIDVLPVIIPTTTSFQWLKYSGYLLNTAVTSNLAPPNDDDDGPRPPQLSRTDELSRAVDVGVPINPWRSDAVVPQHYSAKTQPFFKSSIRALLFRGNKSTITALCYVSSVQLYATAAAFGSVTLADVLAPPPAEVAAAGQQCRIRDRRGPCCMGTKEIRSILHVSREFTSTSSLALLRNKADEHFINNSLLCNFRLWQRTAAW